MPVPEHLAGLEGRIRTRFEAAVGELRRRYEARLRRASEEMLASLGELSAPELEPFAGFDAAELAPRGAAREETLAALLGGARALDAADGQAAVLDALLTAVCAFADRAGVLLVREDGLSGWGSSGFDGEPFAGRSIAWDADLLAGLASGRGATRLDAADARRFAERLGVATAPASAALVPLVLRDRVAAALYADVTGDGQPFPLGALQLLVHLAAQRIELQPLSSRSFSPTLWEREQAPGPGLPLWGAGAVAEPEPAPAVAPPAFPGEEEAPGVEGPDFVAAEELPVIAAPALDAAPAPPFSVPEPQPPAEPTPVAPSWTALELPAEPARPAADDAARIGATADIEGLFLAPAPAGAEAPVEAPSGFVPAAPEPVPAEPAPVALEDSLWGRATPAAEAGFEFEAEPQPEEIRVEPAAPFEPRFVPETVPEVGPAPSPVPPPAIEAAPPLGDATVRIPVFRPGEPVAPLPTAELSAASFGFAPTPSEVPRAEPALPPVFAPSAPPETEDATVLSRRAPAAPMPPPAPEEESGERTAARPARTTEVAPPPDVSGPGLAFAAARAARAPGENALHEEARRLARLLVSEIRLYNEEQVLEGRRNRDLYVRLREDIDRSRQIYDERVHESVRASVDYFHQELVRSLAGGDARALGM